jgi:hypothetical protein
VRDRGWGEDVARWLGPSSLEQVLREQEEREADRMSTAEYQRAWRARKAAEAGREPGKVGRPATQPCGTTAAYRRHLRNGEVPCDACRAANTAKHAELRRRRAT